MFLSERLLCPCVCQLCVFYFLWAHCVEYSAICYASSLSLNADASVAFYCDFSSVYKRSSVLTYPVGKGSVTLGTRIVDLKSQAAVLTHTLTD